MPWQPRAKGLHAGGPGYEVTSLSFGDLGNGCPDVVANAVLAFAGWDLRRLTACTAGRSAYGRSCIARPLRSASGLTGLPITLRLLHHSEVSVPGLGVGINGVLVELLKRRSFF